MNIEYLKTIKTVAALGSYQVAAEKLSCSISTISYQVHKIEEEMNISIFERSGRSMKVTPIGSRALQLIDNTLNFLEAMRDLGNKGSCPLPHLIIAVASPVFLYRVFPALDQIKVLFPNTQLTFYMMNCGEVQEHVSTGLADFGVHFLLNKSNDDIDSEPIGEEPFVLAGSPSLSESERDFLSPHQRKCINFVEYSSLPLIQSPINEYLSQKDIVMSDSVYVDSSESAKRCLLSGKSVAYVPKMTVEDQLKDGTLIELDTGYLLKNWNLFFSHRKKRSLIPVSDYVKDVLTDCIGRKLY